MPRINIEGYLGVFANIYYTNEYEHLAERNDCAIDFSSLVALPGLNKC